MNRISVILISVIAKQNSVYLNYYHDQDYKQAIVRNPEVLLGNLITGTEIEINLYTKEEQAHPEAELLLKDEVFLPQDLCEILEEQQPVLSTYFGLISKPIKNKGRYYMLRDQNSDGLLLATGLYTVKKGKARCSAFDREWPLRYNIVENFFYSPGREESGIIEWKHPSIKLLKIDDEITLKNLNKKFRNYVAGWHRYNFFAANDWSPEFYRKQARLGFIAITHEFIDGVKITPQLQREYAVLDWNNLVIDRKVNKIIQSTRIKDENVNLNINPDPSEALSHLSRVWELTWITEEYSQLIKQLAAESIKRNDRNFRIWSVTLSAGHENIVVAGELGYSIGKTYTSLTGFFHRGVKRHNNFGKLQMVLLAKHLEKAGISFWNLGQPYMEYKLRLGAKVVPRGIFLKRWDKAVRGRTPDLSKF